MNPLNLIPIQYRALALAIAVLVVLSAVAGGSWYLTAEYKDAVWGEAIAKQKVAAAAELQTATDDVLKKERAAAQRNITLEKEHAQAKRKIDNVLTDNRRLARELGGLRDPGRRSSCGDAVPADSSAGRAPDSAAEGRLSEAATEFLLGFAADADRAAEYASACFRWANPGDPADLSLAPRSE